MKAKHHFISSLAAGSLLFWITGSEQALAGAMIGGFFIDVDHIIDQIWSVYKNAPFMISRAEKPDAGFRGLFDTYLRRRKLIRLPLILHSYELMLVLTILALTAQTPFLVGLIVGYVLHIVLDLWRHNHEFNSPLFYGLFYRMFHGF